MHAQLTGTILAGGLSRRMFAGQATGQATGGDKTLLDVGGSSMLSHVIARLRPQVDAMVLNANGDPARFEAFGLPVAADPIAGFPGPLAGILAGMRWTQHHVPQASHTLSVSSDAPFLPLDLADRLSTAVGSDTQAIAMAASGGDLHPVIGLWPVALADDLEAALQAGTRKVLAWTDRHVTHQVDFPFFNMGGQSVDPFFNANTPADLAIARALLAGPT